MNNKNDVLIINQKDYDVEEIKNKFLNKFIGTFNRFKYKPKGKKILIKPNFLAPFSESKPVTTKNEMIIAMIETLNSLGNYEIIISDSPGFSTVKKIARKKGLIDLISKYDNVKLKEYNSFIEVENYKGLNIKVTGLADQVDEIINLARFKTHTFQTLTCATKNLFGLVYNLEKQKQHVKNRSQENFGEMLYKLQNLFSEKVSLNIIDGIVAMEGNGPSSGDKKRMGQIIVSKDPIIADLVACEMINIKPNLIPYLNYALKEKNYDYNKIGNLKVYKDFKLPDKKNTFLGKIFNSFSVMLRFLSPLKESLRKKPFPTKDCIGCGVCRNKCPAKAINIDENRAYINYNSCIKCYVCHEVCPQHAIDLKFRV